MIYNMNDNIDNDKFIKEYIQSEIKNIEKKKVDKGEWKINKEFHSQIEVKVEEE